MRGSWMLYVCLVAIAQWMGTPAFGQTKYDSVAHSYDSLVKSSMSRFDSTLDRANQKVDSIQSKLTSLVDPSYSLQHVMSLKQRVLDSVGSKHRFDSVKSGLSLKIDSLRALNLPADRFVHQLDSVEQFGPAKFRELEATAKKMRTQVSQPLEKTVGKINDKLTVIRGEGGSELALPGNASVPNINIEKSVDISVGDLPVVNLESPLPDLNKNLPVDGIEEKINSLKQFPAQQSEKLGSLDVVGDAGEIVSEVNNVVDNGQAWQSDVSKLTSGDLGDLKQAPQAVEKMALELEEVEILQDQQGQLTKYQKMVGEGKDPMAVKDLVKEAGLTEVKNHFAGKEEVLIAALDKMNKLKAKFPQISSLKEIPKGRVVNAMRGKPVIERLLPGFSMQVLGMTRFTMDINPLIIFRISGRWNAGAGWNERLSFAKWNKLVPAARVYGPRAFTTVKLVKGFSLRLEAERLNAPVPPFFGSSDLSDRQWIWGAFVGLQKDYRFMETVRGNVQFLYTAYDDQGKSPYLEKFNVRMGFAFHMRKSR